MNHFLAFAESQSGSFPGIWQFTKWIICRHLPSHKKDRFLALAENIGIVSLGHKVFQLQNVNPFDETDREGISVFKVCVNNMV